MSSPKITIYTLCWNESAIIPYVMDHWSELAERIVVYDNGSTDNSLDLLKNYPKVEVRAYESGGSINDQMLIEIKNNCWKECRDTDTDWVVMCDMDELLYSPQGLATHLKAMSKGGFTILSPLGIDIITEQLPPYKKGGSIIETLPMGHKSSIHSKSILFNPHKIKEIGYLHGAHKCRPKGRVKIYDTTDVYLLHYKNLGLNYLVERHKSFATRLSQINIEKKWGVHYMYAENRIREDFEKCLAAASPWRQITSANKSCWGKLKRQIKYIITGKW